MNEKIVVAVKGIILKDERVLIVKREDKVILSEEHAEYRWAVKEEMIKYLDKSILKDMNEHDIFNQLSL